MESDDFLKFEKIQNINLVKFVQTKFTNSHVPVFKEKMIQDIDKGNFLFVLDLSEVEYLDSSGLGSIISIYNYIQVKSSENETVGFLALIGMNKNLETMFSIFRMKDVIPVFNNLDDVFSFLSGIKV